MNKNRNDELISNLKKLVEVLSELCEVFHLRKNTGVDKNSRCRAMYTIEALDVAILELGKVTQTKEISNCMSVLENTPQYIKVWLDTRGRSVEATAVREVARRAIILASSRLIELRPGLAASPLPGSAESPLGWKDASVAGGILNLDSAEYVKEVIRSMRCTDYGELYVLGCFDRKKTIFAQQTRALSLCKSLFAHNLLKDKSVAIIGAGFGGLTAAVACAELGSNVTVFEKSSRCLPLQSGNSTRYLHPRLFEWPCEDAFNIETNLPFLNWRAAYSDEVVKTVLSDVTLQTHNQSGRIKYHFNAEVEDFGSELSTHGRKITVYGNDRTIEELFDVVIIAIGFGVEDHRVMGVRCPHYWDNDAISQVGFLTELRPRNILISGTGDGALIDVIRAAVRDFRHDQILKRFPVINNDRIRDRLVAIEVKAEESYLHESYGRDPYIIGREYRKIIDEEVGSLDFLVQSSARWNKVYHCQRNDSIVFRRGSAIINRFIVCMLHAAKIVTPIKYDFSRGKVLVGKHDNRLHLREGPHVGFDAIVLRHGTDPGFFFKAFPKLKTNCKNIESLVAGLDLASKRLNEV